MFVEFWDVFVPQSASTTKDAMRISKDRPDLAQFQSRTNRRPQLDTFCFETPFQCDMMCPADTVQRAQLVQHVIEINLASFIASAGAPAKRPHAFRRPVKRAAKRYVGTAWQQSCRLPVCKGCSGPCPAMPEAGPVQATTSGLLAGDAPICRRLFEEAAAAQLEGQERLRCDFSARSCLVKILMLWTVF